MGKDKEEKVVLAGDIGGTKTHLGLFVEGKTRPLLKAMKEFPGRESPGLESIVDRFMEMHPALVTSACFGVAGPVLNGRCKTTNLPWEVSEVRLKRRFRFPHIRLINDLAAMAQPIPMLKGRELVSLNEGRIRKGGTLALLAPGTGHGQAFLVFQGGRYMAVSSEGGHVDFAPRNEAEVKLWRYLNRRLGHVSIERLISGPGLVNIYSWLRETGRYGEPVWLKKLFAGHDPAKVITETALQKGHPLCREALNVFVSILGASAGNLALTGMATGGVYLGGGIPPKILPALKSGRFMEAFTNKGRFAALMETIPVWVIVNERAVLLGAAKCALDML